MPRRKKIRHENRPVFDSAIGIAGWLLAVETMVVLERRGVIRAKDALRIINGAIAALDEVAEDTAPHPGFPITRAILEGQAQAWAAKGG